MILFHFLRIYFSTFLCFLNQHNVCWIHCFLLWLIHVFLKAFFVYIDIWSCFDKSRQYQLYNNIIKLNYTEIETSTTYYDFDCDFHWPTYYSFTMQLLILLLAQKVSQRPQLVHEKQRKWLHDLVIQTWILFNTFIWLVSLFILHLYHVNFIVRHIPLSIVSMCQYVIFRLYHMVSYLICLL